MDKREHLWTAWGNFNWCSLYGKQDGSSSSIKSRTDIWSSNLISEYLPKRGETLNQNDICTSSSCVCVCVCVCVCACTLSCVSVFVTPWTVACQAPPSMGFPRQEYWSGLSFATPGDLSNLGVKAVSLASPTLAGRFFTTAIAPGS